jgi:transposase
MEACGGTHHWAREFRKPGHEVELLHARLVKTFIIANKDDFNNAEVNFIAVSRPNKRTVEIKT